MKVTNFNAAASSNLGGGVLVLGSGAGGDLGGTLPAPTVVGIGGVPVDTPNGIVTDYLNGAGHWTVPAGGGGSLPWSYAQADGGLAGNGSTDDTTAFQAWITSVTANGTKSGRFRFEPGTYLIGGALQDTGAFNGQILLPNVSTSATQITLTFQGPARPPFALHGSEPAPSPAGFAILNSTLTGASGTAAVISGGNSGSNNIEVNVIDLVCLAPDNPTMSWWNLEHTQGGRRSGVFISADAPWPSNTPTQPTHSNAYGIKLPGRQMSNYSEEDGILAFAFYTGIKLGELCVAHGLIAGSCIYGLELPNTDFPFSIDTYTQTACTNGINVTGDTYGFIKNYSGEHSTLTWHAGGVDLYDPSNYLHGDIRWVGVLTGVGNDHTFAVTGGSNCSHSEIGPAGGIAVTGTPTVGQAPVATSSSTASWQTIATGAHEVVMVTGSVPPDPVLNSAGDDWVYSS
jgi:hypothetical protein